MSNDLIDELRKLDKLAQEGDFPECISAFDSLIQKFPLEHSVHRKKADILEDFGKFEDAYNARQKLADLEFKEPADLYELALSAWQIGSLYDCANWADQAILECERHENYYYYQASIFYKAVAQIATANYGEAKETVEKLEDGYSTHVSRLGMISKEDIVAKTKAKRSW